MSRQVITDLVLPVVLKELSRQGVNIPSYAQVRDEQLFNFMEEQLKIAYSICGKSGACTDLRKAIEEAKQISPEGYKQFIARLLQKYINLRKVVTGAKKLDEKTKPEQIIQLLEGGSGGSSAPPDRFSDFRQKRPYNVDRYIRRD